MFKPLKLTIVSILIIVLYAGFCSAYSRSHKPRLSDIHDNSPGNISGSYIAPNAVSSLIDTIPLKTEPVQNTLTTRNGATPIIVHNDSLTILKNDSVYLAVFPSSGYNYQWYLNGAALQQANQSNIFAKNAGAYTVTMTSDGHTTTSAATKVVINTKTDSSSFVITKTNMGCKGNESQIHITALKNSIYKATLAGNNFNNNYSFSDTLTIKSLPAGDYTVTITADDGRFSQNFPVVISQSAALSVKSVVNSESKSVNLQFANAKSYSITINGVTTITTASAMTFPLVTGTNTFSIKGDDGCGLPVEEVIYLADNIIPYPNPFYNTLNVNVGEKEINDIQVNVVNLLNGKTVYQTQYHKRSGVLQFDLSDLETGLYTFVINMDGRRVIDKVIKK